jgi:hypothetical protein
VGWAWSPIASAPGHRHNPARRPMTESASRSAATPSRMKRERRC